MLVTSDRPTGWWHARRTPRLTCTRARSCRVMDFMVCWQVFLVTITVHGSAFVTILRYDHIVGLGIRVEDLLAVLRFTITVSGLGL